MEQALESYLIQLQSSIPSPYNEKRIQVRKAEELTNDIKDIIKSSENQMIVPVLLDEEKGLIIFLRNFLSKSHKNSVQTEVIKNVLESYETLLKTFGKYLSLNQLIAIKDLANILMNTTVSNQRKLAYSVLSYVVSVSVTLSSQDIERLDLPRLSEELFTVIARHKSAQAQVINLYVLIGTLAKHYPSVFGDKAGRIINHLVVQLAVEVKKCTVKDNSIVGGYLKALTGLLDTYQVIVKEQDLEKIHGFLFTVISNGLSFSRIRFSPRVALDLLVDHATIFRKWLLKQYAGWFPTLKAYALHSNPEDHKRGQRVLQIFIHECIKDLKTREDLEGKSTIIEFFIRNSWEIMDSKESTYKLKILGIKALGECSFSVSEANVFQIFVYLLKKAALIVWNKDNTSKNMVLLATCIESIGLVLQRYSASIRVDYAQQLENFCVYLVSHYWEMAEKKRSVCGRSISVFLMGARATFENPIEFSNFVQKIVSSSLIESSRPVLEPDSVKRYASFWINLMNFSRETDLPFTLEEHVEMSAVLDQQLIFAFSDIIRRLDFSAVENANPIEADEKDTSRPKNSADWEVIRNLVNLLEDLFKAIEPKNRLHDLVVPFGGEVVDLSTKYSQVPDLYRLVGTVLLVMGEDLPEIHRPSYECYMSNLIDRLPQFSDDILFSAVQAILSSPAWLVSSVRGTVTGALISALKMGLTYPPMSAWPLDALEHWHSILPHSSFDSIMEDIVPHLEPYLNTIERSTKEVLFIRSGKRSSPTDTNDSDIWNKTQRRILKLLGRLGPKCGRLATRNEDEVVAKSAMGWQFTGHLEFGLPLSDMKPIIHLDAFLPRILYLVQHTSDLKIRMAACEFLHASVLLLIGRNSQRSDELRVRQPFTPLYSKIFPVVLSLAVDTENVIRQLFTDLLYQLIHWFSRPTFQRKESSSGRTFLGAETALLLDQLMESACSGLDASQVRELAGECLAEFLRWSVKQNTEAALWQDPAAPDFLFQKIRAAATHPSAQQRLGALLVMKKMYFIIRESDPLVSVFAMDLVAHFVVCLAMADQDPDSHITSRQARDVLYHLVRTVYRRKEMFAAPHSQRRTAPYMIHGTFPELIDLLLKNTLSPYRTCRETCVQLCVALAPPQSFKEIMTNFLSKTPLQSFLSIHLPMAARLDVYRWLLQHDVVDTVQCDSDIVFLQQFKIFAESVTARLKDEQTNTASENISETFLTWLEFLKEYLIKVKGPTEFLPIELVVRAALLPKRLGFSNFATDLRYRLDSALKSIFSLLCDFNEPIVSILSQEEFQPDRLIWTQATSLDIIKGLILITSSGSVKMNVTIYKPPSVLLKLAVGLSLNQMNDGGENNPTPAIASNMLIELALLTGLKMELLVTELQNPDRVPGSPITLGQSLRSKLGRQLLVVIIEQLKNVHPFLPRMGNGDEQQWVLLRELIQAAYQILKDDVERRSWIAKQVLDSWPTLEKHAESYGQRAHLKLIVDCLIEVSLTDVKRYNCVKNWIIDCWSHSSTDVSYASELILFLNVFGDDSTEQEEEHLMTVLQEFFTLHFPSKTTSLESDMDKSAYFSVMNRLIEVAHVSAVFYFLVDVFVLEPRHPSLPIFIQSIQNSSIGWTNKISDSTIGRVLNKLYLHTLTRTVHPTVRTDAIETIYVPIMGCVSPDCVERHVTNDLLKDLIQIETESRSTVDSLTSKTVLCSLLAAAIIRIDYERLIGGLNREFCVMNTIQPSADGKDLIRTLTRLVLKVRKIAAPVNQSDIAMYQKMEGAAFNLIMAILSVSSANEDTVDQIFFKQMSPELWNAAVGTIQKYNLVVDLEGQRKKFVVLNSSLSSSTDPNFKGYIPSQYLYNSTLNEDVDRFDFNEASVTSSVSSYVARNVSTVRASTSTEDQSSLVYLTVDELNKHPCMIPLVCFLRQLNKKRGHPDTQHGPEPRWMKTLRDTLLNVNVHTNVVLFILRLVIDLEDIFQPFARSWYNALLIAFLRKTGGDPLNSLFREGLFVVLEWSKSVPPPTDDAELTKLASHLVQFIIKHLFSENNEIMRDNREMFKAVFRVWTPIKLDVPFQTVEELLTSNERKKLLLGLFVLDIAVNHGFFPTSHEYLPRLKRCLIDLLTIDNKRDVSRSSASLCGSILERESDSEFEKSVCAALQKWLNQQQPEVFVDLLHDISIRYNPIVATFATVNLSLLESLYGTPKVRCLVVLSISWPFMEDPWKEIGFSTIESVLKGSNPAELRPVLLLVKNLIPRVDIDQWKPLWPTLVRLSRHQDGLCRSGLYDVFKVAFDLSDPHDPAIAQAVLRACTDQEKELADQMQNFLAEKLPNSTTDRLLAYVTEFCTSEDYFIPYCSHFLLERTTTNHSYRDPIFDQPLDDIPFEVVDLAHLSSQNSFSQRGSLNRNYSSRTFQHGYVRATQQTSNRMAPSLTQSPANWLMTETQFEDPISSLTASTAPSQSLFKEPSSPVKSWKRFTSNEPTSPQKLKLSPSKRVKEAQNQPTIYRKYRKGELPDIQIPPSALIAPLQAVALQDPPTAKILFCHLLTAIRKQVEEIQGSDREFATNLGRALESLAISNNPRDNISSSIIAAILEYFWMNSVELSTNLDKLVNIAKRNHIQALGILALESSLHQVDLNQRTGKKAKLETFPSTSCWFHVAALYGDLQDVDSVRAVVTHLTDCKDQTKMAIENESKSDWDKAFQYYSQVLGITDAPLAEKEFCQEYRLKCLQELGQWDQIDRLKPKTEPWHTRSRVRRVLQNIHASNDDTDGLEFMPLSSVDPSILPDLALLSIHNGNQDRANICINKALDSFTSRYSQLSSLNFSGRQNLLQNLCVITELQFFTQQFDSQWDLCLPTTGDDLVDWDSILALRSFFAHSDETGSAEALDSVNSLRLLLAADALEQKNVGLARQLVNVPVLVQESMTAFRRLIESKILVMERCDSPSNKLERLIKAKETINSVQTAEIEAADVRWRIEREQFETILCVELFQTAQKMQPNELTLKQAKLIELWNAPSTEMISLGLAHARRQAELAECNGTDLAESFYVLAKYCYDWKSVLSDEDYRSEITRSVLASMRYGSVDGQSLFPLVILAIKDDSAAAVSFKHCSSLVPYHQFLPWVNQLVSYSNTSPAVASLLVAIAAEYPAHVRTPLGITRSNLHSACLATDAFKSLELNLPIDSTWEMFLKSIVYLYPPEKAAAEFLNSENCVEDFPAFRSKYLHLAAPSVDSAHGQVHHAFSVDFTNKLEDAFKNGRLKELANTIHFRKRTMPGRKSLRDYSPWLANYRYGESFTNQLEIPTVKGRTLKVQAFRDDIEYLNSKQLPVRLTLLVNGALEYKVLVKHGEDVRQDERIIQLLNIIDSSLCRNIESRKRKLRIRSFEIIPLTGSCGMFQWLDDTLTLKDFLETDPEFRSSSTSVKLEIQKLNPARDDYLKLTQEKCMETYLHIAGKICPFGLKGALKRWSQSPEAFFYLRNRMANSHGALTSALWILGVGDRHLSNFLVSTKNGDLIGIDYGYAFGTATSRLRWPEIVPCRLTTQFRHLIPGLGLNGSIRDSMNLTLRIAKAETGSLIAALSVFVAEPTLEWKEKLTPDSDKGAKCWSPNEIIQRTNNLLDGVHPSEIMCLELQRNTVFQRSAKGSLILPQLLSIIRGRTASPTCKTDFGCQSTNKRKKEEMSYRAALPSEGLDTLEQVDCLIEHSTDLACLSRMYWGWEPWV